MEIQVKQGDITQQAVDAIVNAANNRLSAGAGVCGAIHQAAGPHLAQACEALGHCETGAAVITPGFELKAKFVIHSVGPIWRGGDQGEPKLLARCYESSLVLADEQGLTSIAFPAISTGIYGYPLDLACQHSVAAIFATLPKLKTLQEIYLLAFDLLTFESWQRELHHHQL